MEDIDFSKLVYELENNTQNFSNESIFPNEQEFPDLKGYLGSQIRYLEDVNFKSIKNKNFTATSNKDERITNFHWQIKAVYFSDCSFLKFSFSNLSNITCLIFSNCRFSDLSLSSIYLENLIFIDCEFESCLTIQDFNSPSAKLFGLFNIIKMTELKLINTQFETLKITGSKSQIDRIYINKDKISNIEICNAGSIRSFEIETSNSQSSDKIEGQIFKIQKSSIEEITLKNLNRTFETFEINQIRNTKHLNFEKCNLASVVLIENSNIENIIFLENCLIKNLIVKNGTSKKANFKFSSSLSDQDIFLDNCYFKKIEIDKSEVKNEIYVSNKEINKVEGEEIRFTSAKVQFIHISKFYVKDFLIDELIGNKRLEVSECNFLNLSVYYVENTEQKSKFDFNDLYVHGSIILSNGNFNSVNFKKVLCHQKIDLIKCTYSKSIKFSNIFVFKEVKLSECAFESVLIENSIFERFRIDGETKLTPNTIRFRNSWLSFFDIKEGELLKIEYYFLNCGINTLEFNNLTLPKESIISFSDTNINSLKISQSNFSGGLFFRNIRIEKEFAAKIFSALELDKGKFYLWKSIISANIESLFKNDDLFVLNIQYSTLGNTEFTEFKFDDYQFVFNNSKILNTFIAGSQFPDNLRTKVSTEPQNLEDFNQLVLAYNQLKKVAENNGDIVKSSLMHSRALEYQEKVLFKTQGKEFDKFVFWLNGISNNHGENWFSSIKFIVAGTLFFFFFFAIFEHKENLWCQFPQLFFRDYFQFIDPLAKVDMEKLNWKSTILIFFNKIYVGYGIYQLITAFRRHGKK